MPKQSLQYHFTYAVEEEVNQMGLHIVPAGDSIGKLPANFAVSAGYSKNYDDAAILSIVSQEIFNTLEERGFDKGELVFSDDKGNQHTIKPVF